MDAQLARTESRPRPIANPKFDRHWTHPRIIHQDVTPQGLLIPGQFLDFLGVILFQSR